MTSSSACRGRIRPRQAQRRPAVPEAGRPGCGGVGADQGKGGLRARRGSRQAAGEVGSSPRRTSFAASGRGRCGRRRGLCTSDAQRSWCRRTCSTTMTGESLRSPRPRPSCSPATEHPLPRVEAGVTRRPPVGGGSGGGSGSGGGGGIFNNIIHGALRAVKSLNPIPAIVDGYKGALSAYQSDGVLGLAGYGWGQTWGPFASIKAGYEIVSSFAKETRSTYQALQAGNYGAAAEHATFMGASIALFFLPGKVLGKARKVAGRVRGKPAAPAESGPASDPSRSGEPAPSKTAGPNCFPAGTKIATEHGLRPIEKIKVGDRVWSRDYKTSKSLLQKVTRLFRHKTQLLVTISAAGVLINVTPGHWVWFPGHGWIQVAALREGDRLLQRDGREVTITSLASRNSDIVVYNSEVRQTHSYYVTQHQLLVHNDSGTPSGKGGFFGRIFGSKRGVPKARPIPNATVGDLKGKAHDMVDGNGRWMYDSLKRGLARSLSDGELLESVFNPDDGIHMTYEDGVMQEGNHRMGELMKRAEDPDSSITWETPIYVDGFGG
ncbi:MAG: hypothetical protein JWN52_3395 [Actinomycetia bacterium]|nr:hypothetical protein [Actinomycetes bacterium]